MQEQRQSILERLPGVVLEQLGLLAGIGLTAYQRLLQSPASLIHLAVYFGAQLFANQIVKGGCFSDPGELLRIDLRLEAGAKDKFENIGFRCVKSA